jgi:hypothetical protein
MNIPLKSTIKYLLMQIYEAEEKMWRERDQVRGGYFFGDNNSSYFHKIANGRKRKKNTMYSLKNDGVLIQGTDNLLTHATFIIKTCLDLERVIK